MLTAEEIAPKRAVPILRTAYHQLGELGAYEGRHVQLVYGTVIDMRPMGTAHANAMRLLTRFFVRGVPDDVEVMVQLPLAATPSPSLTSPSFDSSTPPTITRRRHSSSSSSPTRA